MNLKKHLGYGFKPKYLGDSAPAKPEWRPPMGTPQGSGLPGRQSGHKVTIWINHDQYVSMWLRPKFDFPIFSLNRLFDCHFPRNNSWIILGYRHLWTKVIGFYRCWQQLYSSIKNKTNQRNRMQHVKHFWQRTFFNTLVISCSFFSSYRTSVDCGVWNSECGGVQAVECEV